MLSRHFEGMLSRRGLMMLFIVWMVFHVISFLYVRAFYEQNLPHYDSIGSYTAMFEIMNLFHREGFMPAFAQASQNFLSWLQSFFAVLAAPFLSATPESLQLLNSLAMLAFMCSVYSAARAYGAGEGKAFALSLMIFLPDVFSDWWGGVLDLRRDFAFITLLGAVFFMFFSHVWRPSRVKGVVLGLLFALTVYSRDNAVFFVAAVMGPLLSVWVISTWRKRCFGPLVATVPGLIVAAVLIVPWLYHNLAPTMDRRLDPFVIYGVGIPKWQSFMAHWNKPLALMLGRLGEIPPDSGPWQPLSALGYYLRSEEVVPSLGLMGGGVHGTVLLTSGWILILAIAILLCRACSLISCSPVSADRRKVWVLVSGIWALGVTYLVLCFVVALGDLHYSESQIPFFPSLIFFFTLIFVIGVSINRAEKFPRVLVHIALGGFLASLMLLNIWRFEAKAPEPTPKYVAFANRMVDFFSESDRPVTIAFLWHETINYDTIAFYSAQQGRRGQIKKFRYAYNDRQLDFAATLPKGGNPDDLIRAMREQIIRNADFIVLSTYPEAYNIKNHHFLLFEYGQPVADWLLKSDRFKAVLKYELWARPFVVLRRQY